jgi:hypothetical protein
LQLGARLTGVTLPRAVTALAKELGDVEIDIAFVPDVGTKCQEIVFPPTMLDERLTSQPVSWEVVLGPAIFLGNAPDWDGPLWAGAVSVHQSTVAGVIGH